MTRSNNTVILLSKTTQIFLFNRLVAITISPADLAAFSEECEVSKEQAETFLRKHGGDMKAALTAYITGH